MNKKRILLNVLGLAIFSSVIISNNIESSAWWGDSDTVINGIMEWDKDSDNTNNGRYLYGNFHGSPIMSKNPTLPTFDYVYIGNGSTYEKSYDQKVRTAVKSGYGYDIVYYEPYANRNNSYYLSPQGNGVDENRYAIYSSALDSLMHDVDWKNLSGSQDNFSRIEGRPNYSLSSYTTPAGTGTSNSYDSYTNKTGQWRFLGYSASGSVISNPFFPSDGSRDVSVHRSDAGFLNQDIHGQYGSISARQYNNGTDFTVYDSRGEYLPKLDAIEKLLDSDPAFKYGVIRQVDDSTGTQRTLVNGGSVSAELWASSLSLLTNPLTETPIFRGYLNRFSAYGTVVGATEDALLDDLSIKSVIVKDMDNNLIKRFDRDEDGNTSTTGNGTVTPGQQVKVEYVLENLGKNTTSLSPSRITSGIAYDNNALANDKDSGYSKNESNATVTGGTTIRPGATQSLHTTLTVDADANKYFRITGYMHEDYIDRKESGVTSNDWGHVTINVKQADTGVNSIQMIDKSGKVATYMIPGEEYKIRYSFKYTGEDVRFQDYYISNDRRVYYDIWKDFDFGWTTLRTLPGGGSEIFRDDATRKINTLKDGTIWTYETPYFVYQIPKAYATASVEVPVIGLDSNISNNNASKNWSYHYDVIVDNVRVYNDNERPTQDGYITVGLKYDVEIVAPSQVPYFETDLKTHVKLPNGNTLEFIDHVGKGENNDITREIRIPVNVITSGSKNLGVEVFVNADKSFWETDLATQSNNKGSDSTVQLPPINPNVSRGCSIVDNYNSFSVNHSVNNYYGYNVNWSRFNNSASYSFYRYSSNSKYNDSNSYYESYQIEEVLFKSKDTVDNEYGDNGWVDLTKASERDEAVIKAGYGYELAIEVEYNTNALTTQPTAYSTRTSSISRGRTVSNLNHDANIYKDIYVRTSDGKTLSATGMYGTIPAFDVTVVRETDSTTTLRYTMKTTTENGETSPVRIYTSENLRNGEYDLTVWTPTITGVGNPTKKSVNLCDEDNLKFIIDGSMYDDNEGGIIQ